MAGNSEEKSPKPEDPFALSAGIPSIKGALDGALPKADRISKRVLLVAGAVIIVCIGIFLLALDEMDARKARNQAAREAAENSPKRPGSDDALVGVPKELVAGVDGELGNGASLVGRGAGKEEILSGLTSPDPSVVPQAPKLSHTPGGTATVPALGQLPPGGAQQLPGTGGSLDPSPTQLAEERARVERDRRMSLARQSGMSVRGYDDAESGAAGLGGLGGAGGQAGQSSSALASLQRQISSAAAGAGAALGQSVQQRGGDSADQEQKLAFLRNADREDRSLYLAHTATEALSPNEVKRGAFLALRLESGINSDMPGKVKARITEDVYDTITGCRLLIPAMSVVEGTYDSKVSIGQSRNLVVWNYLGFEDGSDLNLGGMQGYDSAGAAGLPADVDNHYFRLFGLAFGMSLVTAGVQLSVPDSSSTTGTLSAQQQIAAALGQQYGQLGAQILGKYMQVQPTLKNSPGERFTILVPQTIVFKKVWRNRCGT